MRALAPHTCRVRARLRAAGDVGAARGGSRVSAGGCLFGKGTCQVVGGLQGHVCPQRGAPAGARNASSACTCMHAYWGIQERVRTTLCACVCACLLRAHSVFRACVRVLLARIICVSACACVRVCRHVCVCVCVCILVRMSYSYLLGFRVQGSVAYIYAHTNTQTHTHTHAHTHARTHTHNIYSYT